MEESIIVSRQAFSKGAWCSTPNKEIDSIVDVKLGECSKESACKILLVPGLGLAMSIEESRHGNASSPIFSISTSDVSDLLIRQ